MQKLMLYLIGIALFCNYVSCLEVLTTDQAGEVLITVIDLSLLNIY